MDQCAAQHPHPSYDLQHLLPAVRQRRRTGGASGFKLPAPGKYRVGVGMNVGAGALLPKYGYMALLPDVPYCMLCSSFLHQVSSGCMVQQEMTGSHARSTHHQIHVRGVWFSKQSCSTYFQLWDCRAQASYTRRGQGLCFVKMAHGLESTDYGCRVLLGSGGVERDWGLKPFTPDEFRCLVQQAVVQGLLSAVRQRRRTGGASGFKGFYTRQVCDWGWGLQGIVGLALLLNPVDLCACGLQACTCCLQFLFYYLYCTTLYYTVMYCDAPFAAQAVCAHWVSLTPVYCTVLRCRTVLHCSCSAGCLRPLPVPNPYPRIPQFLRLDALRRTNKTPNMYY